MSIEKAHEIQNGLIAENQQLKTTTLELQQEIALKVSQPLGTPRRTVLCRRTSITALEG